MYNEHEITKIIQNNISSGVRIVVNMLNEQSYTTIKGLKWNVTRLFNYTGRGERNKKKKRDNIGVDWFKRRAEMALRERSSKKHSNSKC